MLHIPPTNHHLLAAKQAPYQKAYPLSKNIEFSPPKKSGELASRQKKKLEQLELAEELERR